MKLAVEETPAEETVQEAETEVAAQDGNTIIISIKEGKDIYLELPV